MRKVTFGVANSLDNFIAREDGGVDWLLWSDDAAAAIGRIMDRVDTILMGRKTYEAAVRAGGGASPPKVKTYVFSRSSDGALARGVEWVGGDPAAFVRDLKSRPGGEIYVMGGGDLGASLLNGGVVDEIELNIHPILLGSGVPLFHPMPAQIDLELAACRTLEHGCVALTYRVKR